MSYLDTMSNFEIKKALSYLLYKKMLRKDTSEDAIQTRLFKATLNEREVKHEHDDP